MKLEYIDVTGNGQYPNASPANLIRVSDFSEEDKQALMKDIQETVIAKKQPLQLDKLSYIQSIDCSVSLQLNDKDECLIPTGPNNTFTCLLSIPSFQEIIEIIKHVGDGYNWLTPGEYLDEPAFLMSKWGGW